MTKYQHILITGASSGIGEAMALYYANNGVKRLSLCGRNLERLNLVAERCRQAGAEVESMAVDVSDEAAVREWMITCNKQRPLNLIFANAGVATLAETSENVRQTFNINVMGVVNTVLPAIEIFKQDSTNADKHIVITASIAGYHGLPACPSYSASKACVKAWGAALRLNLRAEGIRVSTICPGFIRSRITDKNTCPMPFFMEADVAAKLIARRVEKNVGLIAFPWPMRFASWFIGILPDRISDFIYARMPYKV